MVWAEATSLSKSLLRSLMTKGACKPDSETETNYSGKLQDIVPSTALRRKGLPGREVFCTAGRG